MGSGPILLTPWLLGILRLPPMTNPNPTNRPPLWQVMQDAYFKAPKLGECDRHGYAAEIRAIAEEAHRRRNYSHGELLTWLQSEADRAEAGE
jgi:hypothetical protein